MIAKKKTARGVLLIDKPSGLSSRAALLFAQKRLCSDQYSSKKAGHTGTLDPMATGLLPLCFGEATKFAQFALDATKAYEACVLLGQKTDTADAQGARVATKPVPAFDQSDLDKAAALFLGAVQQTPPMYSALKKDGKKLYEYARQGVEISRAPRSIFIEDLRLTKIDDDSFSLVVRCSKGTYVRTLGEDIAAALGTYGHLTALRRTQTGAFLLADAISLDDFADLDFAQRQARLLPCDAPLLHLPKVELAQSEKTRLQQGQRLNVKDRAGAIFAQAADNLANDNASDRSGKALQAAIAVRLYVGEDFVGLGDLAPTGRLQPKKMLRDE